MNKKGFTLIELLIVFVIFAIILGIVIPFVIGLISEKGESPKDVRTQTQTQTTEPETRSSCEKKLRSASKIEIKEKALSLAKHYNIYVDDEKVAEVTGKTIEVFGDVFTLKTADGKVLASEKECVRFLSLNRAAICYDVNNNITGYIGEEFLRDLFSFGYVFHFYDAEKKEIGKSQKIGKSWVNIHKLYDNEGNTDYDIDKKFAFFADKYVLTRYDFESSIPLEYAIFITCIEDAIADAHSSSDNDDN